MGMGGSSVKPYPDMAVQPTLWGITHPIAEKPKPKSAPVAEVKRDGSVVYFLATCTAAVTFVSMWLVRDDMYGGRSAAHVWWYGWVTALSTGLGALPVAACRGVSEWWMGLANALAAGMMCAASYALLSEGFDLEPADSAITPQQGVLLGMVSGAAFVAVSQKVLDQFEDVHLGIVEGVDARKVCRIKCRCYPTPHLHALTAIRPHRHPPFSLQALLIVAVMAVHSFSEGIAIGVSFRRSSPPQLGMLVTTTLAVHNIPEGFAVSVPLMSKGVSTLATVLWSIGTRCALRCLGCSRLAYPHPSQCVSLTQAEARSPARALECHQATSWAHREVWGRPH